MARSSEVGGPGRAFNRTMTSARRASLYERFSARIYDPFIWLGERRGLAQRRRGLLAAARGRVLKPGGSLLFIEHTRSDAERWGRWQDRLARPWAAFASGCRCNRNTLDLLEASGMRMAEVDRRKWSGMPRLVRPLAIGSAEIS